MPQLSSQHSSEDIYSCYYHSLAQKWPLCWKNNKPGTSLHISNCNIYVITSYLLNCDTQYCWYSLLSQQWDSLRQHMAAMSGPHSLSDSVRNEVMLNANASTGWHHNRNTFPSIILHQMLDPSTRKVKTGHEGFLKGLVERWELWRWMWLHLEDKFPPGFGPLKLPKTICNLVF